MTAQLGMHVEVINRFLMLIFCVIGFNIITFQITLAALLF